MRAKRRPVPSLALLALALLLPAAAALPQDNPAASTAPAAPAPAEPPSPVAAAPTEAAPPVKPAPPQNLILLAPDEASGTLGRKVRGPNGEDMGMIVDVLVDQTGAPRAAIIDFGGFLGVGNRKIAIDWGLLHDWQGDLRQPVQLGLDRAQLQTAPEYKATPPTEMVGIPPADAPAVPTPANDGK